MAKENETFEGVGFAPIGEEAPEDAAATAATKANPEIEALRAQVEELTRQSQRSQDRLISALAGRAAPAERATQPETFAPQVDIDLSDLPDFNVDRAGFNKKLAEKIKGASVAAAIQTTGAAAREQAATAARNASFDSLWDDFKSANPDIARFDDIIEKQAKNLVERAAARGVNADDYVLRNRDQFMEDVAEATRARLDDLGIAVMDDDGGATAPTRRAAASVNRTAGTFGGGRARAPAAKEPVAKPGRLSDELKEVQRKMGYL